MLTPNLWFHQVSQEDRTTDSSIFPYFPDERRVDQTQRDGIETALIDFDDDDVFEEEEEDVTNQVIISYRDDDKIGCVGQVDVVPIYGQYGSDQRLQLAPRFTDGAGRSSSVLIVFFFFLLRCGVLESSQTMTAHCGRMNCESMCGQDLVRFATAVSATLASAIHLIQ